MAAAIVAAEPFAQRRRRVAALRARHGFARQVLDFYGALLGVQEMAFVDASSARPAGPDLASYVADLVVPGIVDVTIAAGPDRLRIDLMRRLDEASPRDIIVRWLSGEDQLPVDRYLARAALGPVLEALDDEARSVCTGPRDVRHCPACGGPPQLSYFAPAGEDLATGPRKLLCARCGVSWGYPRMTCASCGEDTGSAQRIFSEHGTLAGERGGVVRGLPNGGQAGRQDTVFPHVRIEACETCRRYVLGIDMAVDAAAVPVVDELAAIPLDLYARERGFTKITPNLMGF